MLSFRRSTASGPCLPLKLRLIFAMLAIITSILHRLRSTIARPLGSLLLERWAPPNPHPCSAGVSTSDHRIGVAHDLFVRIFSPSFAPRPLPIIVYFHGSGWKWFTARNTIFDASCRRYAAQIPAVVVSVDYRLYSYPEPYDDGLSVLHWLDDGTLLPDLSTVFLVGDSTGGNIAHNLAKITRSEKFRRLKIRGVVEIQPFFGGEEPVESERRLTWHPSWAICKYYWKSFLPHGSDRNHEAANVFGPGSQSDLEDWTGFPPTFVCVGGWDPLRDRQRLYYEGLLRHGVKACLAEYENSVHGSYSFPELPETRQFERDMSDFVRRHCEQQRPSY